MTVLTETVPIPSQKGLIFAFIAAIAIGIATHKPGLPFKSTKKAFSFTLKAYVFL